MKSLLGLGDLDPNFNLKGISSVPLLREYMFFKEQFSSSVLGTMLLLLIDIYVCVDVYLMQASHCPELDTRWTHDYENVQIRVWSYIHRAIREGIWSHRMTIGWVSQASATTSWAMAKSLACQKNARRPCEGSLSCWIRVSDLPFVRPSCGHRGKSCHLRLYLV